MEELKSLGTVLMINYMRMECVKTATLTPTIGKEEKKRMRNVSHNHK